MGIICTNVWKNYITTIWTYLHAINKLCIDRKCVKRERKNNKMQQLDVYY